MPINLSDSRGSSRFDRRTLLRRSLWGAGLALSSESAVAAAGTPPGNGPATYIMDDTSAVADTESGKVVGYIRDDIRIFKGIPYGEIRLPEGRWARAAKARPWTGKRSSRAAGTACPRAQPPNADAFLDDILFRGAGTSLTNPGENCLHLNIWSPGLDNKKRNVMFWVHGGGYSDGSSLMATHFEGENLARHGDVVVVSFNHRLNVFGFLDLTAYGSRFADSANLGMLDAVQALNWVRANISNFGGDPEKITIFGHSGGGSKVSTLLAMPEAKGLFNRAIIQSAGPLPLATPEQAAERTAGFLKLVNVAPSNVDGLFQLPMEKLSAGAAAFTNSGAFPNNVWRAVADGRSVLHEPTQPNAPSAVPVMIGTALHEAYTSLGHPDYDEMNEQQAREVTRGNLGAIGDQAYDVYKAAFPRMNPFEVSAAARATGRFRANAVKLAQNRSTFNAAPTYLYWFQWRAKNLEGRGKSHHELEVPLVFMNSDETPTYTGATAEARALAVKMADTWLAFARTGNPNIKALPSWTPVTPKAAPAMVFDAQCRIDQGSDAVAIDLIWKSRHPGS